MTPRYADVAMLFRIPRYVPCALSAAAREPCWSMYARRARAAVHVLCAAGKRKEQKDGQESTH